MVSFVVKGLRTSLYGPLDLQVQAGECLAVSGPSGAGKSMLLRALADLDPHEGSVSFDGRSANQYSPSQWRTLVAYLPAESVWWGGAVGEYFDEPKPEWFARLGFEEKDWRKPVDQCSTGERQRLALLRMLHRFPKVMLLDEPTASLDADNVRKTEQLVAAYRQQHRACVVWVSHDPDQIERIANRHVELRNGQLHEVSP